MILQLTAVMVLGQQDKDKDEGPSARSDRGLKKIKTSKDTEPTTSLKSKESSSRSSKGIKSQPKSSDKSVHAKELENTDKPQGQEGNLGNYDVKPKKESASRCDWFKKPSRPQEPIDPNWNEDKTPQKRPTQNWLMTLAASTSIDKSLKEFDELMSTPIDFSSYILNGLKIKNLTQEILLGPAFRLLKGTRSNYAKLEYDFEECYKALSENLDWDNPEGGDYPFDLSKPLPLIMHGNRQNVLVQFFINNDLKYLQGGILTMTYTTSTTKTKAAQYELPGIKDMFPNIWSPVKVAYDKYALWGILHWRAQHKSFYANARSKQSSGDASFFILRHYQEYRHGVLAKEKMEQIRKEKSLFHDQGHQQAAKGKEDDEEFREICVKVVKKVAKSDLDSDSSIRLRFILDCVLSTPAFCLSEDHLLHFAKDKLCQNQNCTAFCLRLRFSIEDYVLKNLAFCLRSVAV
nr:hypothetical protein [Tanacetum cinerariifolium]